MLLSRRPAVLAAGLLALAPAVALGQEPDDDLILLERKGSVMGTELQLEVLGPDEVLLEQALDAAEAELRRVEDVFTTWRPSPLNTLNDAAGQGPQAVDPEVADLIQFALRIGELTGGAFDITFAGVGKLWDFKRKPPVIPTPEEIATALKRVDYTRIEVDAEHHQVTVPAGMRLGLGGIAKGYGVDRAMAAIMKLGIRHAFVNAGGDLKALGRKHGKLWEIAVRHPRDRENVLALLPVSNTCVVTSGDYERFFDYEGKRYHHIIDPRTGYPSEGCISATVVAPDAAFADALATALCVLGPDQGLALVERLPRVEALVVGMDGSVRATRGLGGRGTGPSKD